LSNLFRVAVLRDIFHHGSGRRPDEVTTMANQPVTVLGISGSLRKASYNTAALHTAMELAPEGLTIIPAEIADLPLYNEDLRHDSSFPAPAERLRKQIREADGLLFVTPEYNYSVSGVLKNAIDWASRPPDQPFAAKPVAIMGASPGAFGTARAQYHLRQIGVSLDMRFVNRPEVMIAAAADRFDSSGRLTHQATRDIIAKLLAALYRDILAAGRH
jgi:chromate reductase